MRRVAGHREAAVEDVPRQIGFAYVLHHLNAVLYGMIHEVLRMAGAEVDFPAIGYRVGIPFAKNRLHSGRAQSIRQSRIASAFGRAQPLLNADYHGEQVLS